MSSHMEDETSDLQLKKALIIKNISYIFIYLSNTIFYFIFNKWVLETFAHTYQLQQAPPNT